MASPVINSASTASATRFTSFSYQTTATNTPTSFAATGLPAGLSINTSTGEITGTPTAPADDYVVTLTATNGDGTSPDFELTITLAAAPSQLFKGLFKDWNENNYLRALVCLAAQAAGGGSGVGLPAVPGSAVGSATTPLVVGEGTYAVSIIVRAGEVTPSAGVAQFSGILTAGASYTWSTPGAGFTLPEITFTGDADADYTVTWVRT